MQVNELSATNAAGENPHTVITITAIIKYNKICMGRRKYSGVIKYVKINCRKREKKKNIVNTYQRNAALYYHRTT